MSVRDKIRAALSSNGGEGAPMSSTQLSLAVGASLATVKRQLEVLVAMGQVQREGQARATRYRLPDPASQTLRYSMAHSANQFEVREPPAGATLWSETRRPLLERLQQPLAMRTPVTYQRALVDDYVPNQSSLLPPHVARQLAEQGRMRGQQPAGTYARKVLEPMLVDLSWSSSRLEGNRYSLLATEELFKHGALSHDLDAVMLLNHKAAIEFLVDAAPRYGLTRPLVCNLHALLMQDLLADSDGLGSIRQKVVNISDTTYVPCQVPLLLGEMLESILTKARQIKNPVESAFFLWVHLAYLQPFEDGNKRTSRMAANIPLMLYNSAPLSFMDVDPGDYACAMLAVYEFGDVSLAADLFAWVYGRSIDRYAVLLEAMGQPDPLRLQFREALNEAIGAIVRDALTLEQAVAALRLDATRASQFVPLLEAELRVLGLHNCARYRLAFSQVEQWTAAGRPR